MRSIYQILLFTLSLSATTLVGACDSPDDMKDVQYPVLTESAQTSFQFTFRDKDYLWESTNTPLFWEKEILGLTAELPDTEDDNIYLVFYEGYREKVVNIKEYSNAKVENDKNRKTNFTLSLDGKYFYSQRTKQCPGELTAEIVGKNEKEFWGKWTAVVCDSTNVATPISGFFTGAHPKPQKK